MNVAALAKELGTSDRTVFRDLEAMRSAGVALRFNVAEDAYELDRDDFITPVDLTLRECLSLLMWTRSRLSEELTPDVEAAASAAVKIENALPPAIRDQCGRLMDAVSVDLPPLARTGDTRKLFETITQAIAEQVKLRCTYDSYYDGQEIELTLRPYEIAFIARAWYVIGYSELQRQVRTFKLERFISARKSDIAFVRDGDFSLDAHFGNAWKMIRGPREHRVRIRFSPKVAGNVDEVLWHKTQQTHTEPDGSLIFEATVDGIGEIQWWVLGYGREAEVLEPPELREKIRTHAAAMSAMYPPAADSPPADDAPGDA